jgi:hypothetical protein
MCLIDIGLSRPSGGRTDIILYSAEDDRDRKCWLSLSSSSSWLWSIIGVIAIAIADNDER